MSVNVKIRLLLLSLIIPLFLLTTCDSPLGMGDPIDWEPPVLTLLPKPPSPMYVKFGAQLTGIVTDNTAVDRVILRDSSDGRQLFTAQLLSNNRWQINLDFSPEQNGETILADVVAFDKNGNSGAESIASVVLIIDIRPPVVDDIWVQRTAVRTQDLLSFLEIIDLETSDPRGEVSGNVDKYQNGAFWIRAKISEEDTTLDTVVLKIFDSEFPDIELLSLERDSGTSKFAPQWYIAEDMILDAGDSLLNTANYKINYKNEANVRYYYRLQIVAIDKSGNESVEDQKYICLWNEADYPKGMLDTRVVGAGTNITLTKGSTIPVEFFDDDKIDWAYAALFTKDQWAGTKAIAPGFNLSTTADDKTKFEALQTRLRTTGSVVYNWMYDRYPSGYGDKDKIVNVVPAAGADEKSFYVTTGNNPSDFGDFILVTLVSDMKTSPHKNDEYKNVIKYRKYNITLVDENAPLIVFDKVNGSPEENTFPSLTTDGKFTIHGYTLREDKDLKGPITTPSSPSWTGGNNKVVKFRLAWVPFGITYTNDQGKEINGAEAAINDVKAALEKGSGFPAGVQWWDLSTDVGNSLDGEVIGGSAFRKQHFTKTFNILGGTDDKKGGPPDNYNNFTYNGVRENTSKLFIFFAEDNMGHTVVTQFYLLGNRTPPAIDIYDITDKLNMTSPPVPNVYNFSPTGEIDPNYIGARDTFNAAQYPTLKGVSMDGTTLKLTDKDKTETYRAYPRGTVVKFWAMAQKAGQLTIKKMKMEDITFKEKTTPVGYFSETDYALSYVEYFPEVSQRVFLFTAEDTLGNIAKVQRTIAIASAATLTSITTAKQNGTYPANEVIELRANFDGMIKLQDLSNGRRPKLNVMYQMSGSGYGVRQIECDADADLGPSGSGQLYLNFKFTVPANATGQLVTIYDGIPNKPTFANHPAAFPAINSQEVYDAINRPITVMAGYPIIDAVRGDTAYTPGNVIGFLWNSSKNSLQDQKDIKLDGIAPTISLIEIKNTKDPFETGKWYLKSGESISFQLTASENLKISGDAYLRFRLQRPNNAYTTYNATAFEYRKVTGNTILFTLDVNRTNISQDGILQNDITLINAGNITDDAGNPIVVSTFTSALNTFNINNTGTGAGNTIYFDLTPPNKPVTQLSGTAVGSDPTTTLNYSLSPYLGITNPSTTDEPYGIKDRYYSLDGGLTWVQFPTPQALWTTQRDYSTLNILNGQWNLKTRFIDKAGNEGATTDQLIHVNNVFPKLIGVGVKQPNATYISGDVLEFTLNFDDIVKVPTAGTNVTMTLNDFSSTTSTPGGTAPTYTNVLTATATPASGTGSAGSPTVTFRWALTANTYDMLNGLKITALTISGLTDKFGNQGPTTGTTIGDTSITASGGTATYNYKGIIVSTISPQVRSREPQNAQGRTGNITAYTADPELVASTTIATGSISADNRKIKLNFSKPMQKGNGTITIRPRAGYAIPAVFENEGYYVSYTYDASGNVTAETRSSSAGTNTTYVSSFYDIFNSINNTQRNTLIGSTSMSAPAVSNITGLSVGPYLKTTQGLSQGAGYTGNYGNPANQNAASIALPGNNAPGPRGTDRMIPDVQTKWVLIYTLDDLFSTTGTVSNIRAVLDAAKWRWQEIAVTNTNVEVSGNSVTITLSEPLLPGLQWDVFYTAGTFTDQAGNSAPAIARGDYWFWSKGVQRPVIRVDRKSYDARPANNNSDYRGDAFANGSTYNANGIHGTGIAGFQNVAYRITSETPQARLFAVSQQGTEANGSGIKAAWTGNAVTATAGLNITANNNILWQGPKSGITNVGIWAKPNLIFRSSDNSGTYVIMEDGMNISKSIGANGGGGFTPGNNNKYYGFRSYNKDATYAELNGLTVPNIAGQTYTAAVTQNFIFEDMEASKNYVVAQARIDHQNTGQAYVIASAVSSLKGFEGVFRTVVAMNQEGLTANGSNGAAAGTNWTASTMPMMIAGTNVRSGLPTVSGFPLKDGVHRTDSLFIKVFNRNGKQFLWVSTEIVCLWYIQLVGKGDGTGSYSNMGDIEDWISAGYGDLSYALNLATW